MTVGRCIQARRAGRFVALGLMLAVGSTFEVASAQSGAESRTNRFTGENTGNTEGSAGTSAGFLSATASNGSEAGDSGESATEVDVNRPDIIDEGVHVSDYMTVDLFVQDEDLANVLQMLSLQTQKNIVASRDVNARVTANLYGVTFYEALDAILNVNGYGFIEKGNFIYVHTLEEMAELQKEDRQVISKVIQLNYLNANDAAEFVVPLLSDVGAIKTNGDVGDFNIPEDTPTGSEEFALAATLVVYDYAEQVAEIQSLLDQLDTRPSQVLVEATILQTQVNEDNAWGIDFAFLNDLNFTDFFGFGGPRSVVNSLISDSVVPAGNHVSALNANVGNTAGAGTLKLGFLLDDVALFIRMLDEVTDVSILSNPKILALNRQPARVLVGRKLGFLNTTSTQTATTQTVEFLDTGTQLAFRPFISKDGNIRLELKPRVSEGVIRQATDATGAAVTIPDEITQEVTTNVIVPDGATVVLGGLFKETTTLTRRQVPVLGDIPVIGAAFRGHEDGVERQEIIFMIKPTIVSDRVLLDQGERALVNTERVRAGSRQGLLPWSRERQTARLNMKAREAARGGDMDKAMWNLRRSLELYPNQPDAIRMREQLGGKVERWPDRSMINEVINGEAANRAMKYLESAGQEEASVDAIEFENSMIQTALGDQVADVSDDMMDFAASMLQARGEQRREMSYDPLVDDHQMPAPSSEPMNSADHNRSFVAPDEGSWDSNTDSGAESASDLDAGDWRSEAFGPVGEDATPSGIASPLRIMPNGYPAYIAGLMSSEVNQADWADTMGQPWLFAQPVSTLPFGLFWTTNGFGPGTFSASGHPAAPAQFMTDVLTSVEPSVGSQD